jgi:hypothetical protein
VAPGAGGCGLQGPGARGTSLLHALAGNSAGTLDGKLHEPAARHLPRRFGARGPLAPSSREPEGAPAAGSASVTARRGPAGDMGYGGRNRDTGR